MSHPLIVVIADDITGAAEIAGIASDMRMSAAMLMADGSSRIAIPENYDVCVVATDTRSENTIQAALTAERICGSVRSRIDEGAFANGCLVFKKVDSVLRGNILVELRAAMLALGQKECLLLAQNPSKERVISGGRYSVDGQPLMDTPFRFDPEFPANTDRCTELLLAHYRQSLRQYGLRGAEGGTPIPNISSLPVGAEISDCLPISVRGFHNEGIIYVADATTEADVERQLRKCTEGMLLAGGADLFRAVCKTMGGISASGPDAEFVSSLSSLASLCKDGKLLIVCGSTQSGSLLSQPLIRSIGGTECAMPDDVFHGASPEAWISSMLSLWREGRCLIMSVGQHEKRGADYARRLRSVMAEACRELALECQPAALVIEGGATAYSALCLMEWHTFSVVGQLEPGVVALRLDEGNGKTQPLVVLKPGSYLWGRVFGG